MWPLVIDDDESTMHSHVIGPRIRCAESVLATILDCNVETVRNTRSSNSKPTL